MDNILWLKVIGNITHQAVNIENRIQSAMIIGQRIAVVPGVRQKQKEQCSVQFNETSQEGGM